MHVLVTGATGWLGSAIVQDLVDHGHSVTGTCRNRAKASGLEARGAKILYATLDDLDVLRQAASSADAVIHTAFNHNFTTFSKNVEQDRQAIEALGEGVKDSGAPLLVTSGLAGLSRGASEAEVLDSASHRKSEQAALTAVARGSRAATVRLPPSVHATGETHGFLPMLIALARKTGVSAYIGEGDALWSGAHRDDAARLYRLAIEQGVTEGVYHAVAEEDVPFRTIAEAIARQLGVPAEPREPAHFGWLASVTRSDLTVSSARTRALLGWQPHAPSLLADLADPLYYGPSSAASA